MLYIGLDIHWRMSVICILDKNGKLIKFTTVHGPWSQVIELLKGLKRPFAICYEASCEYGHIHDQLRPIAKRVVVAHPGQLRLIFRSMKKNDRVDATPPGVMLIIFRPFEAGDFIEAGGVRYSPFAGNVTAGRHFPGGESWAKSRVTPQKTAKRSSGWSAAWLL